jgi:hypothetical protein
VKRRASRQLDWARELLYDLGDLDKVSAFKVVDERLARHRARLEYGGGGWTVNISPREYGTALRGYHTEINTVNPEAALQHVKARIAADIERMEDIGVDPEVRRRRRNGIEAGDRVTWRENIALPDGRVVEVVMTGLVLSVKGKYRASIKTIHGTHRYMRYSALLRDTSAA